MKQTINYRDQLKVTLVLLFLGSLIFNFLSKQQLEQYYSQKTYERIQDSLMKESVLLKSLPIEVEPVTFKTFSAQIENINLNEPIPKQQVLLDPPKAILPDTILVPDIADDSSNKIPKDLNYKPKISIKRTVNETI